MACDISPAIPPTPSLPAFPYPAYVSLSRPLHIPKSCRSTGVKQDGMFWNSEWQTNLLSYIIH